MKERGRGAVEGVEHSRMEPKQPCQAASIRDHFGQGISVLRQTLTLEGWRLCARLHVPQSRQHSSVSLMLAF